MTPAAPKNTATPLTAAKFGWGNVHATVHECTPHQPAAPSAREDSCDSKDDGSRYMAH